jgi:hypothetical protein
MQLRFVDAPAADVKSSPQYSAFAFEEPAGQKNCGRQMPEQLELLSPSASPYLPPGQGSQVFVRLNIEPPYFPGGQLMHAELFITLYMPGAHSLSQLTLLTRE